MLSGACICQVFPASNIFLDLKLDDNSVGAYEINGDMICHVVSENAKLVTR